LDHAAEGEKIRRAITQKHPSVLVVGDSDVESGTVGFRLRGDDAEERGLALETATARLVELAAAPR
jgi:threonyl-tRNA synthetase